MRMRSGLKNQQNNINPNVEGLMMKRTSLKLCNLAFHQDSETENMYQIKKNLFVTNIRTNNLFIHETYHDKVTGLNKVDHYGSCSTPAPMFGNLVKKEISGFLFCSVSVDFIRFN